MKGKRQIPEWATLVLALAVALIAIIMIVAFHQRADESHQAEILLSLLEGESYHLDSFEFQFERKPDPKLLEEVQGVESQIAQTLDELTRLDPGDERLQQVSKAQLEFETNMDEMFRLIAAGNLEKADIFDNERTDPSFNALSEKIANTSAIYSERARQAETVFEIGSAFIVISAVMIIGFLILQFQKMRQRAELMAIEQKALRQSEECYRTIIETAHDLIWTLNNEGNLTFFNKQFEETSGYKVSEWVGKSFAPLIYAEDLPNVQEALLKTLQGNSQSYEARVYVKDGEISTLLVNAIPWYENNKIIGTVSFGRDITERKKMENSLKESLSRISSLVEAFDGLVYICSKNYEVEFVNKRLMERTGYNPVGQKCYKALHDLDTICPWCVNDRVFKGETVRWEVQSPKDNHWYYIVNTPINHVDGSVSKMAMIQDVSERKQAEEELKQSKEFSETVINSMNDAIAVVDVHDYKIINANQVFLNTYNLKKEDVKRRTCYEITHHRSEPCTPPDDICPLSDVVKTGKTSVAKHVHYLNDGTKIHMEVSVSPIRNQKGEITQVVHTSRDITERIRGEEIIRDQAALLDKAQDAIIVRDLEHRIIYWNKSAARLYGFTEEEAIGKNTNELLDKEELPELIEAGKRVIEKGEWTGELRQVTKEGKEIIVESRWTLIRGSEGVPKSMLIINTDITEKKKLESQLLHAQRMESVGTLAGGIAHDINNVLTPIMLSQELLREKLTDEESKRLLNTIERSTKRGANLMKQIMSFARGVEGERNAVQVAHLISEIRQVAKETFPRNIETKTDIPKDLWTISGDATQLHQVMMNLCVNARDAMLDGGILSISAENFFIDESYAKMNTEARIGPHIVITVSDTGTGIPPKILDRIFEPFFTTKEHGKGTGLGLSTSLGIVKSHGGFITVYSEVGKGTAFKVYLPAITTTETLKAEEQQHELPAGHGESILVVDDEDQIREMAKKTLETHGYKVFIANDGKEAITLYSQHRELIRAVLMDMMMPVMDGTASVRELYKINPHLKIIAASGLTEIDKLAKIADNRVYTFLPKPYTAEILLKKIHEVLDAK